MKKTALLIFCTIILLGIWWTFNVISQNGKFTKYGHASVGIEYMVEDRDPIYMGYPFKWEGIGKPRLEKLEFIQRDGTIVAKNDDEFKIQPFIARTGRIGALDEKGVKEDGLDDDLVSVKGYKVDGEFYLVLRVEFLGTNTNPINDISTLRITYEKFRTTQMQNIHFGEGLITDE